MNCSYRTGCYYDLPCHRHPQYPPYPCEPRGCDIPPFIDPCDYPCCQKDIIWFIGGYLIGKNFCNKKHF